MRLIISFLLSMVLILTSLTTGCNKDKAMQTVRDAKNKAAKALIYIANIGEANNASFQAGNIPKSIHKAVNDAVDKALKGVNVFVDGIDAAEAAINAGADPSGQVNILKALFDQQVVHTSLDLLDLVAQVPPALKDKISGWVAAIQLLIDSISGLFSDAGVIIRDIREVSADA